MTGVLVRLLKPPVGYDLCMIHDYTTLSEGSFLALTETRRSQAALCCQFTPNTTLFIAITWTHAGQQWASADQCLFIMATWYKGQNEQPFYRKREGYQLVLWITLIASALVYFLLLTDIDQF